MPSRFEKELLDNAFLMAAGKNDLPAMKDYLAKGASINAEDRAGNNALHIAARGGDQQMGAFLIDAGIDKGHCNHDGETPLFEATQLRQGEMVQALISWGVKVDIQNHLGETAIFHAEDVQMVDSFIKAHADINIKDRDGTTPLMRFAKRPKATDSCKALIDAGANLDLRNERGQTALAITVNQPIFYSKGVEWQEKIYLLTEAGANPDIADNNGVIPADSAAANGLIEIEKHLRDLALKKELSVIKDGLPYALKLKPLRLK